MAKMNNKEGTNTLLSLIPELMNKYIYHVIFHVKFQQTHS